MHKEETSKEILKDGIIFFEPPLKIDYLDFQCDHLDCDAIIVRKSGCVCLEACYQRISEEVDFRPPLFAF